MIRLTLLAAVCGLGLTVLVRLARSRLTVVTVLGTSMVPTCQPGDRVLVVRSGRVRRGCVVVARPPGAGRPTSGLVIKRVAAVSGDEVPEPVRPVVAQDRVPPGRLVLIGDGDHRGARCGDSRLWGFFATEDVLGVVIAVLSKGVRS